MFFSDPILDIVFTFFLIPIGFTAVLIFTVLIARSLGAISRL